MTRYVVGADVALHLAEQRADIAEDHQLLAPTLMRSQVLSALYQRSRAGSISAAEAERSLDHLRGLRIRLLGDRVLQRTAWKVAEQLGWPDTCTAEYVALTQLQADAFVTLDAALAEAVGEVVATAPVEDLLAGTS